MVQNYKLLRALRILCYSYHYCSDILFRHLGNHTEEHVYALCIKLTAYFPLSFKSKHSDSLF